MAKSRAYQMIEAANVAQNVHNCGQTPATESQARPLSKLPAAEQAEAWQEAVENDNHGCQNEKPRSVGSGEVSGLRVTGFYSGRSAKNFSASSLVVKLQ